MKNLFYILFTVAFIFSGCEKEEESNNSSNNNNNTSSSIIGTWDLTEIHFIGNDGYYDTNGSKIITSSYDSIMLIGMNEIYTIFQWTFLSNGFINTYIFANGNSNIDTLSYVKSDNQLVIDDTPCIITTLSSSSLTFYYYEDMIDQWSDNDTIYFSELEYGEYRFNRSTFTSDNIISKKTNTSKDPFFKGFMNNKK